MRRETADDINQAAAAWAARADRDLSPAERAELASWLAADPRRAGAYMRMSAVLASTVPESGATAAAPSFSRRQAPRDATRRRLLAGAGGAIAASLLAGGLYVGLRPPRYETRKGEKRVVALDDGSIVTLNTATRLDVRYSANQRLVQLAEGEALFDVATDRGRPFIVRAGNAEVRAVGTSFTVAKVPGRSIEVLVREGVVEVVRPGRPHHPPMRAAMNTRAVVAGDMGPVVVARVDPLDLNRELAWREGRLAFAGESLSQAVAQFARYSETRIVVRDPVLARSGIAGVFDANDPVGFAQAAALSLKARAEVRQGEVLIRR